MKYKGLGIIVLLVGLFANLTIFAAKVDKTLYTITLPVASESAEDLQKALPQALHQVLVQISGNTNIVNSAFIQQQLAQASNFVQNYTYENNSLQDAPASLVLKVQFDPQSVNQLLQKTGQTVPPPVQYPPLLVWIAVPSGQTYTILDSNAQDPVAVALRAAAQQHHMTVLLPLLDLQDMNDITPDQVWQLNTQAVTTASLRYDVQTILLGKVSATSNDQWQGDWVLLSPQRNWQWHTVGASPQAILQNVLNNVAQTFAKPGVSSSNNSAAQQHLKVHVTGVAGLDQFAAVVKYFRGLVPVNHVETADVTGDSVTLDIVVAGGAAALDNAVQTGQALLPDSSGSNTNTELYYQWVGSAGTINNE
jgi:hypothetical protein